MSLVLFLLSITMTPVESSGRSEQDLLHRSTSYFQEYRGYIAKKKRAATAGASKAQYSHRVHHNE